MEGQMGCPTPILLEHCQQKPSFLNNIQSLLTQYLKCPGFTFKKSCQEQEDLKLNEKAQSIDVNIKIREMLQLSDTDVKAAIIKNALISNYNYI